MPRKERSDNGIVGDLQNLSASMDANKEELPQLEPFRLELGGIVAQIFEASRMQAALKASSQESSKQRRQILIEGKVVANVIRTLVKAQFGPRSEKLVEFGVQPFRGRKSKKASETPAPPTTPPADAGSPLPVKSDL